MVLAIIGARRRRTRPLKVEVDCSRRDQKTCWRWCEGILAADPLEEGNIEQAKVAEWQHVVLDGARGI